MFVVLDGGVALPVPRSVGTELFQRDLGITDRKWKAGRQERWQRAYTHCFYSLFSQFEEPVHKAINHIGSKMLGVSESNLVALRFLGEMRIAGYLDLPEQKMKGSRNKTERLIIPTKKLLGLDVDIKKAPESSIKMPAICGEDRLSSAIKIRHGVSSQANKKAVAVIRDISEERFTVNEYILQLVKDFPPGKDDPSFKSKYMLKRCLNTAEILRGKSFRFGAFLDSRSRMYDDTTCGVSPQGCDWEKALIIPTYAEPMTPEGVEQLILTAWGYSEIEWDMTIMVRHARNPVEFQLEWMQADKPYSYMACANLLSMYDNAPEAPLPAFRPYDGRCSGLQHWSALGRSEAITAHLGMEEDEHPLDIYEKVAEDWCKTLSASQKGYALRKTAKIPVMTWGYSATRMTSMDWLDKLYGSKRKWDNKEKAFVVYEEGLDRATAGSLGCDLYNQINVTLAELNTTVEWVCNAAETIAKAGNCDIHWPTPDGFECKQRKLVGVPTQLKVILSDFSDLRVGIIDYSSQKPATLKHKSAIAPNVIHSLDATHLRMVARRLAALGLPMVFVHDSFSTHVNHAATLYKIIVETFAELYSGNWLEELHSYWEGRYGVVLDSPPAQGNWNPEKIKYLDKFFI